ncbi:MAG: response regulator [Bacteroidetes bacterium]|nr:response regulator [Bacteroidota bacterium]
MKSLLVSNDPNIKDMVLNTGLNDKFSFEILDEITNPIEIISSVCSEKPGLLIADDDYISPNSLDILRSIKKLCKNTSIIFITSNDSLELGRQISPLGIVYYGIKPFSKQDFHEILKAV